MFSLPQTPGSAPNSAKMARSGPAHRGRGLLGGPGGGSGTPKSARRTSMAGASRLNMSTSSAAGGLNLTSSHLLEETEHHVLQSLHASLPVVVAEILTMAENPADVTACLSPQGWAWLVHGRRLAVWRYQAAPGQSRMAAHSTCRELALPPSDLAHSARLVNVFVPAGGGAAQTPACIAVSPEGIIRYWPSIAHESSSVEVSADLQGQECCSLTDVQPVGSLLATTTSTVVLVWPESSSAGGQHSLGLRTLKTQQGLLGGLGRRVSSLFWGGGAGQGGAEAKLVQVLGQSRDHDPEEQLAYVLTASSLQKWMLIRDEPERMYYNCDVEALAKEAFASSVWRDESSATPTASPSWLRIWLLDMQFSRDGLSVLMAANNPQVSQQVYYALGTVSTLTEASPMKFRSFCLLKHTAQLPEEAESGGNGGGIALPVSANFRFLLPGSHYAYVYNRDQILCCSAITDNEEPDVLDFSGGGNSLLGAGCSDDGAPIFFAAVQGLVTLAPAQGHHHNASVIGGGPAAEQQLQHSTLNFNESLAAAERASSRLSESLNISVSQSGIDNLTMSESKSDQLKAAFLLFCQRNIGQSTAIIEELFPASASGCVPDASLDKLVLSMSRDLIDDFPASDPRWMESVPGGASGSGGTGAGSTSGLGGTGSQGLGVGSSMSLLILHQLEDKQTALEFYINFLKEVGLWQRLSSVTLRECAMPTSLALCEHVEKTAAAIALRTIHSEHQQLIERAIKKSLSARRVHYETGGLTAQDHFYRQISRVEDIIVEGLQSVLDDSVTKDAPRDVVANAAAVNKIVITVLRDSLQVRQRKQPEFQPSSFSTSSSEHISWTSSTGPRGLRSCLIHLFRLTETRAFDLVEDAGLRQVLSRQLVDLADLVLDGFREQLGRMEAKENEGDERRRAVQSTFEKCRGELITPLVDRGFYEESARLAEKYLEFPALIRLCELTKDDERLERYMRQFGQLDFATHVFDWHVRQGKPGRLLSQVAKSADNAAAVEGADDDNDADRRRQLGRFLKRGHEKLSWLHEVQTGEFGGAADTLKGLAENEGDSLDRKKTMLSLAKLSSLAADDEHEDRVTQKLNAIEHQLNIVAAQELLPKKVLDAYDFERETMRVLAPREIIELYVGDDNPDADHLDFKKALDLLDYVTPLEKKEEDVDDLRLHVWSKAILRNNWPQFDVDQPLDQVRESVFFKLVEFCYLQGQDPADFLPPSQALFEFEDLQQWAKDVNFKFLLQTGYEHVGRLMRQRRQEETTADVAME